MFLKIEIYSDIICPWCYLGKRRLEIALQGIPNLPKVDIHYLPFELNPDTPDAGFDRKQYLESRYGSRIKEMDERLKAVGHAIGVEYYFDKAERIPNTRNAHRLVWFAGQKGLQEKTVTGLYKAYFTDGVDIGDGEALAALAAKWGMDHAEVRNFLSSDKGVEEVRAIEEKAYNLGITGVPFFLFNGKAGVSGAQEVETFTEILEKTINK